MAPSVLPATIVFSPPKASSTPETNDNKGTFYILLYIHISKYKLILDQFFYRE